MKDLKYIKTVLTDNPEYFSYSNLVETGRDKTITIGEPIAYRYGDAGKLPEYYSHYFGFKAKIVDGTVLTHREGDGQSIDIILEIDGQLYRAHGYYSSWDESEIDYDTLEQVEFYQKSVTAYRPVIK